MKLMHRLKTGALFRASLRAGAMLGGGSEEDLRSLTDYAEHFGLAFQITDDILDVTADSHTLGKTQGKDAVDGKPTYVSLLGLEGAQALAGQLLDEAQSALHGLPKSDLLGGLARYVVMREN